MEFFELLVSSILADWLIIVCLVSVTDRVSQTNPCARKLFSGISVVRGRKVAI